MKCISIMSKCTVLWLEAVLWNLNVVYLKPVIFRVLYLWVVELVLNAHSLRVSITHGITIEPANEDSYAAKTQKYIFITISNAV